MPGVDVEAIEQEVREGGDDAVLSSDRALRAAGSARVAAGRAAGAEAALAGARPGLRESLETAADNIRAVAEAQLDPKRAR